MSSKQYFAYIRVSTPRQGQLGTSLIEQQTTIEQYAFTANLNIVSWFEEQETAAKRGRPVFRQMLKCLKQDKASGIIIYKIDRSARNLKDWAEIGELIDAGIEVHFANEKLDLDSRGGRLSADIQAVIAADFIRNLREETKRGFYGRIRQGFYPMPAPLGYLNSGSGKAKEIDHVSAPHIKKIFKLYATGEYGLRTLTERMQHEGLRSRNGQIVSMRGIAHILHNLFYIGVIRIKNGEYFQGKHLPIIPKQLFYKVQTNLQEKTTRKHHNSSLNEKFLFRRFLTCAECHYRLIGEVQKGYVYYRCHTRACIQKTIREELVEKESLEVLESLYCNFEGAHRFKTWLSNRRRQLAQTVEGKHRLIRLSLSEIQNRLLRLTDTLIAGTIEEKLFVEMKNKLIVEELTIQQQLESVETTERESLHELDSAFQFVQSACLEYKNASYQRKRELINALVEKFLVKDKSVNVVLRSSFAALLHHKTYRSNAMVNL